MSTAKKVLFIGIDILALGIVVLDVDILQSPTFQCGYNLNLTTQV